LIATAFEFRRRFWIIFALFAVAFTCYFVDRTNVIAATLDGADAVYRAAFAAAAVVAFTAAAIRTWASAYLRSEVVKDPAVRTERLVADGPYRHVRNPLYLGTWLLAVAFAPLASRLGAVVLVVGMATIVLRLIGREEQALLATQGEAYRAYLAAVPRLVPALRPRVPRGGGVPRWGQAFAGEAMMWAMAVGLTAFAVTFDGRVLYAAVGLGLLSYTIGRRRA